MTAKLSRTMTITLTEYRDADAKSMWLDCSTITSEDGQTSIHRGLPALKASHDILGAAISLTKDPGKIEDAAGVLVPTKEKH